MKPSAIFFGTIIVCTVFLLANFVVLTLIAPNPPPRSSFKESMFDAQTKLVAALDEEIAEFKRLSAEQERLLAERALTIEVQKRLLNGRACPVPNKETTE